MDSNTYSGNIYSFWDLLQKSKVEVPIIQRDYAQGREDKKEIRDNFLLALYTSLETSNPIKLDFIYGSSESGAFQPLDGQQRLTTLFLLHWYSLSRDPECSADLRNNLLKFTYETRISSREFCEALVRNAIAITEDINDLKAVIENSAWFVLSWRKDPTIDAMLRTLSDIHNKFKGLPQIWTKLVDDNTITFHHVELENIGLTDDLYIKMNARGKLLSPFENFKASFQKRINDNNWEQNGSFLDTFACKIDTIWTDLFWFHRKEDSIDEAFMRFVSTIAMLMQSIERKDDRLSNLSALQENPNAVRSEHFSERAFGYLRECFDIYHDIIINERDVTLDFPLWQHAPANSLFSAVVYDDNLSSNLQRNSSPYTQKVLFYAQTEYFLRCRDFSMVHFLDWMRVIRNIVSRGDVTKYGERPAIIRSFQQFDGVINLIYELSEGCLDIYKFLTEKEIVRSAFAKDQVEEEKLKAKLVCASQENREAIFRAEDNNLLRGRLEFIFYCIGYTDRSENFNLELFNEIQQVLSQHFDNENELPDDLRRALLTIEIDGHYGYYEYWWSFWNVVGANKRCLIDKYRELEWYLYSTHKEYMKKLVLMLTRKSLSDIIEDFTPPGDMPQWKVRLIKDPQLLTEHCKSKYLAIPDDNSCCYLLKSMRPRDIDGCEKVD